MRRRAPAAALVEQQDVVARGIEQTPMVGAAARAGAAVQEYRGLAGRVAAALPVDAMAVAGVEVAVGVGFDRWVHRQAPGEDRRKCVILRCRNGSLCVHRSGRRRVRVVIMPVQFGVVWGGVLWAWGGRGGVNRSRIRHCRARLASLPGFVCPLSTVTGSYCWSRNRFGEGLLYRARHAGRRRVT